MKSFKRKLAGFLAFAMVLGLLAPGAVQAQAEEAGAPKLVTLDLGAETAKIDESVKSDFFEYTEYTKAGDNKFTVSGSALYLDGEEVKIKDSAWDAVEDGATEVDLEWVSKKKDNVVIFRHTDAGGNVGYEFNYLKAQETSLKAGFVAAASGSAIAKAKVDEEKLVVGKTLIGNDEVGYIYLYTKDADRNLVPVDFTDEKTVVEWKKGANGDWNTLDATKLPENLKKYRAKGATLYFRLAADSEAGEWASKEVKLSYKKQANQPSVKLDVSKHTIALKKGQQYRVKYDNGSWSDWTDVLTNHPYVDKNGTVNNSKVSSAIAINKLLTNDSNAVGEDGKTYYLYHPMKIQVRTVSDKAIPSKVATINVKVAADLLSKNEDEKIEAAFTVSYDENKGITLTNKLSEDLQFVVKTATDKAIDANTKWSNLKAQKVSGDTVKPGTAKIKANKVEKDGTLKDGEYSSYDAKNGVILVRRAGNKKENILAGPTYEIKIGTNVKTIEQKWAYEKYTDNTPTTVTAAGIEVDAKADTNILTVEVTRNAVADVKFDLEFKFTNLVKDGSGKVVVKPAGTAPKVNPVKVETVPEEGDAVAKMSIVVGKSVEPKAEGYKYTCTYEGLKFDVVIKVTDAETK